MKAVISLFFVLISIELHACELKKDIVSLSGPLTMVLEEMDLLKDKRLLGISKFHPIKKSQSFNGQILLGGVFLSKKILKKYQDKTIIFDESKELRDQLKKAKISKVIEIQTRDQDPFVVTEKMLDKVSQLSKNCEQKINKVKAFLTLSKSKIQVPKNMEKAIFYLGEIKSKKPPLVFGNDGFVMYLKKHGLVKSYPTELSYIPWSQKVVKGLVGYNHFGIMDGKKESLEIQKVSADSFNLKYRGVLIPGIRQVRFLSSL